MEWIQSGHVAIVTGGSRGLGKALARELLGKGLKVIIDGRSPDELERARQELAGVGDVVAVRGDVADAAHVHALVKAAESAGRLDLLVNNASTLGKVPLPAIDELEHETFRTLFDVNVFAPIHLMQHALKLMARSDLSTIVNITSDAGVEAYPTWGGYGATKAALEHVSRVLAAELEGSSTRVLVFDPGDMNTTMHRDAIPDADPAELRDPADSARALLRAIAGMKDGFARARASDVALNASPA
ncbi:MAG TPA: SDR family oxidoreductase [Candidatus Cybelea sp.]|jgi:NAD(P)-dependent dehydrogenase (short-subunit alcohol dehydrogenase family)